MPYMDPDLFQRLTLLNQYRILAAVDPEGADEWKAAAEAVTRNWPVDMLPGADWLMSNAREPFGERDREFVLDVLSMYEALQRAEDGRIVTPANGGARFDGFDGNGETAYMAFARDLVKRQGSFDYLRFSNSDFNSHHPTLEVYERMLEEWAGRGRSATLTAADYQAILDARVHPSNRP